MPANPRLLGISGSLRTGSYSTAVLAAFAEATAAEADWDYADVGELPLFNHAFTGGVRAQYQIRETLVSALARPVNTPEIVVGMVATKIEDGRFVDDTTIEFARNGFSVLFAEIAERRQGNSGSSRDKLSVVR